MPFQPEQICTLPSRMLLATDLTDLKDILPVAIDSARICSAELKLVHVLPYPYAQDVDSLLSIGVTGEVTRKHAENTLRDAVKEAEEMGVRCTWGVHSGQVAHVIAQTAREWGAERVIVGSHGLQKFQQGLLGSTTEAIFHEVDIPVLAVGPAEQLFNRHPSKGRRFLLATALDRESFGITESVLRIAKIHKAELTILHVIPEIAKAHPSALRVRDYAESKFREILSDIGEDMFSVTCIVEAGSMVETILRTASQGKFDLLVLGGVSGYSFCENVMPGIAYGIICAAPCPVLLLKESSQGNSAALSSGWQRVQSGKARLIH
jgi:nucleotide-binding universal stress UspA family protein